MGGEVNPPHPTQATPQTKKHILTCVLCKQIGENFNGGKKRTTFCCVNPSLGKRESFQPATNEKKDSLPQQKGGKRP